MCLFFHSFLWSNDTICMSIRLFEHIRDHRPARLSTGKIKSPNNGVVLHLIQVNYTVNATQTFSALHRLPGSALWVCQARCLEHSRSCCDKSSLSCTLHLENLSSLPDSLGQSFTSEQTVKKINGSRFVHLFCYLRNTNFLSICFQCLANLSH